MKTIIQFGILVNLNISNKHNLQNYDRLQQQMQKIDVYNYLKPFNRAGYSLIEDMIDDEVKGFADDAKWTSNFDGAGEKSSFYLVCYLTDANNNPVSIERIKKLYY